MRKGSTTAEARGGRGWGGTRSRRRARVRSSSGRCAAPCAPTACGGSCPRLTSPRGWRRIRSVPAGSPCRRRVPAPAPPEWPGSSSARPATPSPPPNRRRSAPRSPSAGRAGSCAAEVPAHRRSPPGNGRHGTRVAPREGTGLRPVAGRRTPVDHGRGLPLPWPRWAYGLGLLLVVVHDPYICAHAADARVRRPDQAGRERPRLSIDAGMIRTQTPGAAFRTGAGESGFPHADVRLTSLCRAARPRLQRASDAASPITTTGCRAGSSARNSALMSAFFRLMQAWVGPPWSTWNQMPPPRPAPRGRVQSRGEVPGLRL